MNRFSWDPEDNRCFACGDNPWGLQLDFQQDGDWLKAETELHENYSGFQGTAHGGIVATLLDEAASWAVMKATERVAPSFELNCNFKRPVPIGELIEVKGKVLKVRHGVAFSKSQVSRARGELLAKAEVKSKLLSSSEAGS